MKTEPTVSSETPAINSDAGELPKKEQITFRTWRKLKNNKDCYKCFWTDDLETLKNHREYLRKRAEHTGKIEDAHTWRRQAAILRREITESKRKSFQNFISHIDYQKDNQKTYKYLARIQNDTPYSNKVPIQESNAVITSDTGIANCMHLLTSTEEGHVR